MERLIKTCWDHSNLADYIRQFLFSPQAHKPGKQNFKKKTSTATPFLNFPSLKYSLPFNKVCYFATSLYDFSCLSLPFPPSLHTVRKPGAKMLGIVSMATGLGTNKVMAVFSIPPPARFTNRSCLPTAKIVSYPCLPQAPSQAHRIRRVYYGSVYTQHQY